MRQVEFVLFFTHYTTAKDAWKKLQVQYAGKTVINKHGLLNILLNIKRNKEYKVGGHIATIKTMISRMAAMDDQVSDSIEVAILVSSFSKLSG